ncbi:ATP-binding cassette domain-containing protein [Microbacterium luticocti]|uniref:ATP-binding cassette domain-containing protein n=1 Tax=Microbacterium luticocti TaxID=451764 RepID=UPI00041DBEAC|nr:ATP-binding cassette domain-containing protein [Microbacterium luticocti]
MVRRRDADVAIRCSDLSIARASGRGAASVRVVDGLDATLPHGATLAVLGPTGAGKSSLAAVLAGADETGLAVVGGDAWVEGIPVRHPGRAHRTLTYVTGHLAQGAGARLAPRLTVEETIASPVTSRDRRVNRRALSIRVAALLDELQLPLGTSEKYPYELSAGMRQRVAFARAVMLDPRVLIADELFANLDVHARDAVTAAVRRRRDEYGMATLLVGNDREGAQALDARVIVLRGGHVVAVGEGVDDVVWTPGVVADPRLLAS